jgi:arabinan endo-1,5-alpha-L-arabinosidase
LSAVRAPFRSGLTGLLAATLVASVVAITVPAHAERIPRPVLTSNFADPTVTVHGNGFVGFSTGSLIPRSHADGPTGSWRPAHSALVRLPSWSHADGDIWASDIARVGRWWVLYFAAPVRGIGEYGRCIGVARSRSATAGFKPVGGNPLVCPSYVDGPAAEDQVPVALGGLPRAGVIDPSLVVADGRPHLVYKTDRIPSSIRMVALSRSGLAVGSGEVSRELLRSEGVVENPVLVEQPEGFVLLVSEGDWTTCSYRTLWLRSIDLASWTAAETGVLLDSGTTRLCGPGGADLVEVPGRPKARLYLHGWTCHSTDLPCAGRAKWDHRDRARGVRAMYAAVLGWSGGLPPVEGWLDPR